VHLAPSTGQPLPQACWQWLRAALSLSPLLALADEVGIDCGLVRQVVRDRAVDLLQLKDLEVLADGLRRLAPAERVDDRIEGHASAGNVVVAVPLLDLVLGHATLILLPLRGAALNTRGIRCSKALRDSGIASRETPLDARVKFETCPRWGAIVFHKTSSLFQQVAGFIRTSPEWIRTRRRAQRRGRTDGRMEGSLIDSTGTSYNEGDEKQAIQEILLFRLL